jgi:hypothetical protein
MLKIASIIQEKTAAATTMLLEKFMILVPLIGN